MRLPPSMRLKKSLGKDPQFAINLFFGDRGKEAPHELRLLACVGRERSEKKVQWEGSDKGRTRRCVQPPEIVVPTLIARVVVVVARSKPDGIICNRKHCRKVQSYSTFCEV